MWTCNALILQLTAEAFKQAALFSPLQPGPGALFLCNTFVSTMSASKKKSVLDQLVDAGSGSDSEDDSQAGSGAAAGEKQRGGEASSSGDGSDQEQAGAAAKRAKKAAISLEDLQRAGYSSGPSVLLMKAPQEQQEQQWNWCVASCMAWDAWHGCVHGQHKEPGWRCVGLHAKFETVQGCFESMYSAVLAPKRMHEPAELAAL